MAEFNRDNSATIAALITRAEKAEAELAWLKERYRWRSLVDQSPPTQLRIEVASMDAARRIVSFWRDPMSSMMRGKYTHWRYCDDGPQEAGSDEQE